MTSQQLDLGFRAFDGCLRLTVSRVRAAPRRMQTVVVEQLVFLFLDRRCDRCELVKPLECFVRNGKWYRHVCKDCWATRERERRRVDVYETPAHDPSGWGRLLAVRVR